MLQYVLFHGRTFLAKIIDSIMGGPTNLRLWGQFNDKFRQVIRLYRWSCKLFTDIARVSPSGYWVVSRQESLWHLEKRVCSLCVALWCKNNRNWPPRIFFLLFFCLKSKMPFLYSLVVQFCISIEPLVNGRSDFTGLLWLFNTLMWICLSEYVCLYAAIFFRITILSYKF